MKKDSEVGKSIISSVAGSLAQSSIVLISAALGVPVSPHIVALFTGGIQGVILDFYHEMRNRRLTDREFKKVDDATKTAIRTFYYFAERDRLQSFCISLDASEMQNAYEVAEHICMEAIRQSEAKKLEVLGRYYGYRFYHGPDDWQDMHQIVSMTGALTFRQIVLIRLICEGFEGYDHEWFITNQSACVEVNRLQDYGLWMTEMARFKDDSSANIQLKLLKSTSYAHMVYEVLMLDKLSDDDVKRTLESLDISEKGEKAEGITKEEYEASTLKDYDEVNEELFFGKKASIPNDISFMSRGQSFVTDAKSHDDKGNMMLAIDCIMKAVDEYRKCKAEKLYQPAIDDALVLLMGYFGQCEKYGGLRILRRKREFYEGILNQIESPHLVKCMDYLARAEETDEGFDRELKKKSINDIFEV